MKILQKIWDEFVYGGHLVAVGDISAIYAFSLILGINITWTFLLVIYLGVMSINYFNRYEEFDQDILTNPERSTELRKYKKFIPLIVILSFLIMTLVVSLTASRDALFCMIVLFLIGILYTIFLKRLTREIVGFKNFMTTLPYALLVVFLFIYYGVSLTTGGILILLFYFMRMFLNTALFDIRDIASDKKESLKTFAIVFGKGKTLGLLTVLNVLSAVPIIYGIYVGILPLFSAAILFTIFYAFYYLKQVKSSDINKSFLYNVIIDSEFIFWLPYILIGGYLL